MNELAIAALKKAQRHINFQLVEKVLSQEWSVA